MAAARFRPDLYQGTADSYDRFRPAYPAALIADLAARSGADGTGRLIDLACGTGQVCVPLSRHFAQIQAVDQEPEMIALTRRNAARATGQARWHFAVSAAEDLTTPAGAADLLTIGNAFHRLRREAVAAAAFGWLRPGGQLALLWGGSPYDSAPAAGSQPGYDQPWQDALRALTTDWQRRPAAGDRIPAGYPADRLARPDSVVLGEAGFWRLERREFTADLSWTIETITGFLASTSVLSPAALRGDGERFRGELRDRLLDCEPSGRFRQRASFACELARKPG